MKLRTMTLLPLTAPLLVALLAPTVQAAKSPAMESCSAEWKKMKDAGTIVRADMAEVLEQMFQGLRCCPH